MKLWKHTLFTAVAFFGVTGTVLYTSCEKDTCQDLVCRNGGSCSEGYCRCQPGYEGTECEQMAGSKFIGRWIGNYTCPATSPLKDTVEIWFDQQPNKLKFVQYSRKGDTLTGTAVKSADVNVSAAREIEFGTQSSGAYRKYTKATIQDAKLTLFLDEVFDVNTGQKKTCNFIGFK